MIYATPALRWLIKADPNAALAVWHRIRDDECQHFDPAGTVDHHPEGAHRPDATEEGPDDVSPEMLHEIRPSVDELIAAAGWFEWPNAGGPSPVGWATRTEAGKVVDAAGARPRFNGETAALGGLTFYLRPNARRGREGGLLVSYLDAQGKERRPVYLAKKPRGGKRPHRTPQTVAETYLTTGPDTPSPMAATTLRRAFSGAPALWPAYHPTASSLAARAMLDTANDNTPVRPRVTVCPLGIARGARFIGGMCGGTDTSSAPGVRWSHPEPELLSPAIEELAARGTLASIGVALGYKGGYADRGGKRALLEDARALVADNDNNTQIKIAA